MNEDQVRKIVQDEISKFFAKGTVEFADQPNAKDKIDKTVHEKHIQILDARHIQVGRKNGTQLATSPDQKLAFFGATPIVQGGAIAAPTGGATKDNEARTAIANLITAIKNIGITS